LEVEKYFNKACPRYLFLFLIHNNMEVCFKVVPCEQSTYYGNNGIPGGTNFAAYNGYWQKKH